MTSSTTATRAATEQALPERIISDRPPRPHATQTPDGDLAPSQLPLAIQEEREPGLIAIYRTFAALHLAISLFGGLLSMRENSQVPGDSRTVFTIIWQAFLLLYLYSPRAEAKLGKLFLPVALIFGSIMPLIGHFLLMNPALVDGRPTAYSTMAMVSSWQLFLSLLIPLLLIGWQYSFGMVVLYTLATTFIEHTLLYWGYGATFDVETGGIAGSRTIIFLFTGYVLTRLMSAQRLQRRKLAEANHQLMHYAATAEQLAVSRERNRLARELHDTLAHTLSALSVQLEAVDSAWEYAPDQARGILHKALAGTRNGLTETRRALHALRAAPLEDLGLVRALLELAESSAKRAGMQLDVQLPDELPDALLAIPPDVEQTVYRVAQEALSNTLKHSNASRVKVCLSYLDEQLTLEIMDDGRGFDAESFAVGRAETAGHYGLRGMKERADLIGGQLKLESRPGIGTRVQLHVSPL